VPVVVLRCPKGLAVSLGAAALGFATLSLALTGSGESASGAQRGNLDLKVWRDVFARPAYVPNPPDNPPSAAKVALGERLFNDRALSVTGRVACATCHDPTLAFTDGVAKGAGVTGVRLRRNTPSLWNLAWSPLLYWDGRARSLEDQAKFPLEHADEMGARIDDVAGKLQRDESYARAFREAFPDEPRVTGANMLKAIASFERSIVSPPTRFDRWIEGDPTALTPDEIDGFMLFVGKGQCVNCHTGFAFTDRSFHDIGLPDDDLGRGPILGLPRINHGFKTPGLRELAWTAPYMHDGSKPTLEAVIAHYSGGFVRRQTLSADLNRNLKLSKEEKANLVAFLMTLSSENPPRPASLSSRIERLGGAVGAAVSASQIGQKGKRFTPDHVRLKAGERLKIFNDDTRTHNVRIDDPRMPVNSGAQEPGDAVEILFSKTGTFAATCGIHPTMRLEVEVQ
jgi:cytochrome c peroxidase